MSVLVVVLVVLVAVLSQIPANSGDEGWPGPWAISRAGVAAEGEQLEGSTSCGAGGGFNDRLWERYWTKSSHPSEGDR